MKIQFWWEMGVVRLRVVVQFALPQLRMLTFNWPPPFLLVQTPLISPNSPNYSAHCRNSSTLRERQLQE